MFYTHNSTQKTGISFVSWDVEMVY